MTSHFPLKMTIVSPASFEKPNGKANSSFQVIEQTHQGHIPRERTTYQRPYYYNTLTVENRYISLLSLINVTYPPRICSLCDKTFRSASETDHHYKLSHRCRRFLCLHPHCDRRFSSRTALHFHMTRSHLINQAPPQYTIQEPPFMQYNVEPNIGRFSSFTPPSPPLPSHSSHQHVTMTTTTTTSQLTPVPETTASAAAAPSSSSPSCCDSQKMSANKQHHHHGQQEAYQHVYASSNYPPPPNDSSHSPATTKDSLLLYHMPPQTTHGNSNNADPEGQQSINMSPNTQSQTCITASVPQ
ncbi:predicted protein [Lichtheimia corymbifera JMRC:FSU:9682]|uniref:C2H2-type domain-containing protein n=1 Tax=Lichtheimia corymbifera JMRC:FSU:9682 TaxID=1263082 RepID=A0A068S8C3_9FUNG|nr:predicted protein [Lichtheimia corymbifera JMRC:FSU:9682]